jgi:hypothetical protein
VYADITLESETLHTHNNVAVFTTDAPVNAYQIYLPSFKIGQVSDFPVLSHGLPLYTNTNELTRTLQSVNKRKKNIQCCQLKYFQCNQHKQILLLNFLVFPLLCPLPVCMLIVVEVFLHGYTGIFSFSKLYNQNIKGVTLFAVLLENGGNKIQI